MRPLIIDDTARQAAQRVIDFAEKKENHYIVGYGGLTAQRPPGDDSRHVLYVSGLAGDLSGKTGFRCVFSITEADGATWRHLSISIPPPTKYPNPYAVYTIAQDLFHFTGWNGRSSEPPASWAMNINKDEHCIVVAQRL